MIVDPDAGVCESLRAALASPDRRIETAGSPEAAIERLRRNEFDLAVIGLDFPGKAGIDLVDRVGRNHRTLRLVVVSERSTFDLAVRSLRAGAVDYVEKPFVDVNDVARRIASLLDDDSAEKHFKNDLVEQLSEKNRALDAERRALFRKMNVVQRNLREQVRNLERSREIYYLDLTRVMTILDNIVDGIAFTDQEGKVILINPSAAAQIDVQPFEALGKSFDEITGNRNLLEQLADAQTACAEAGTQRRDVEHWTPDGEKVYFSTHTTSVRSFDDGLTGTLTIIQDVTLRRKTDELKNQFLSIVAHELRTPLTGIKAFSTILGQQVFGDLNEKQNELVESIIHQSDRLGHEIDKIINLGRLESEDFIPDKEAFAIGGLFKTIASPFRLDIQNKELDFAIELEGETGDEPLLAWADRRDIRRAIQSILENAVKFTPPGGRVRLGARPSERGVEIWVSDTGIGIDPHYHKVIFEKFKQIENPLTRRYGGSGLGLSFAGQIVKAHGSEIRIESELDRGSLFSFLLPAPQPADTHPASPVLLAAGQGTETDEAQS